MLSNRGFEFVVNILYIFPSPKRDLYWMQCNKFCLYYRKIVVKKTFFIPTSSLNTINTKKLCFFDKCMTKKCHDVIYPDFKWKSFLSFTYKHDLSSQLFSNLFICYQPPKQLETWVSFLTEATKGLTKKIELLIKQMCICFKEPIYCPV